MKPRATLRSRDLRRARVFRNVGIAICLLIVLAWAASTQLTVGLKTSYFSLLIADGDLGIARTFWNDRNRFFWRWERASVAQWSAISASSVVILPLWLFLGLAAVPTSFFWWRSRPRRGHCRKCGYDLTGNVSGRCPECGRAVSRQG